MSSRQDLIRNSLGTCLGGALLDSLVVSVAPQKAARSGRKYGDVRSARTFAGAVEQWLGRRCHAGCLRPIKATATPESTERGIFLISARILGLSLLASERTRKWLHARFKI